MAAKKKSGDAEAKPFPLEVNGARGEVPLWIDDVPPVVAAEMGRLAAVSARLECKSFQDLFIRLSGVEAAATLAGIDLLVVRGDRLAAIEKLKLKHFSACATPLRHNARFRVDGNQACITWRWPCS